MSEMVRHNLNLYTNNKTSVLFAFMFDILFDILFGFLLVFYLLL